MPGGHQVEATLDAQPTCDVRIPPCEPQVAYVVLDGHLGSDRYHVGGGYDRSIEITRVYSVRRFLPATCNQKRPISEVPINGQVVNWPFPHHAAECPVHKVRLSEGIVPVHFGKGAEDEGMLDETVGLPFAVDFVAGGCVPEDEPVFARVLFCERCRQEKRSRGR